MRVAVTGSGGFIGRAFVSDVPRDWDVTAVTRRPASLPHTVKAVDFPLPGTEVPAALTGQFDAVVHLAGNSDHGRAVTMPWADLEDTAVTAAWLLHAVHAQRYVILSSAAVYAGLEGLVSPDSPTPSTNPYALSKLYVEAFARGLAERREASVLVLRLFNAFGPGERPSRLIPRVASAIRSRQPFRLTADPSSLSDPLGIWDVVRVLVASSVSSASGVFDLCGGDPRPIAMQIERIADAMGDRLQVVLEPNLSEVPIHFYSDPSALEHGLELAPFESFDAALERYLMSDAWLSNQGSDPKR